MNSKEFPIEARNIAGPFRQFQILFWKNGKLFLRNKLGTFGEIFMACLFLSIVIIIRYLTDIVSIPEDSLLTNPPQSILRGAYTEFDRDEVYYYPDNDFVMRIVESAMKEIEAANRGRFKAKGSRFLKKIYSLVTKVLNIFV